MFSRLRKFTLALPALLAVLALSACGDSHTRVTTGTYAGESGASAPYLSVGPLSYEVQNSRELNPYNTEDAAYLHGLTAAQRALAPGEEWFAVFLQVYNNSDQEHQAADTVTISDTQDNIYHPIVPEAVNEFAYHAGTVPAASQLPVPGSTAAAGPTQGMLLLFKIQIASLDNRSLELKIVNPENPSESASAELDV